MSPLPKLSRREREVMDLVYELGNATAARIQENMADPPTYSAVRSIIRGLVNKGHLVSEPDGPRYVYAPTMSALRARRSAMRRVLKTFFGDSVEGAVATLLELREGGLTPEEHDRLQAMIEQAAGEGR
ncbi:BlaI/MecI/CopY family transcriptional regulator [Candidatus Palauibacter sp.]|uniref:BlaI/MecI/CopY family transcriptional regulator n=1 Tax=Candidatus Palauibacter sp. TaxID=3101350 RepID=UPI003B019422